MTPRTILARHSRPLALLVGISTTVGAQVVDVRLTEAGSQSPIAGAVVRLVRDSTKVIAQALTNAGGRATLRAPASGVYRIRINRIGYTAVLTDTLTVADGQTLVKPVATTLVAVTLSGLEVQTKSECGNRAANAELTGQVWEQVRTALTANVLTQQQWAIPLTVRTFRRDLSIDGDSLNEVITGSHIAHGPPFASPDPRTLIRRGYAVLDNDEMTFSAPDAALLLTEDFATTHCFHAVPGKTDALVGLAFEPVPRRRLSDVRGTLWVNRQTAELQSMDYAYTNLPPELADYGLRGRLDFKALPTGAWIVSYWHIRMPRMEQAPRSVGSRAIYVNRVGGYVEEGGRVTVEAASAAATAVLTGRIFDSTTSQPLAGAILRLQGDTGFVMTGADGRFTLPTTTGGMRTATVTHPKLGLTDDGSTRSILLSIGDTATANFAVPGAMRLANDFCGSTASRSGIVGLTWLADTAHEDLDVQVTWELTPGSFGEERGQSGPRGFYILCDLPSDLPLTVRLKRNGTVIATEPVKLKAGSFVWLELRGR